MPMIARKRRHLMRIDDALAEADHQAARANTLWWVAVAELVALCAQQAMIWFLWKGWMQ